MHGEGQALALRVHASLEPGEGQALALRKEAMVIGR